MKLLSCHIENFGKLKDCSLDFTDGIHMICEENGWGKSTFAAFIRAMFYGLEGERKKSIEENERKRYKPWQGGVFGGWLMFQVGDKRYKVSRIFYDKESKDEFELRDGDTNTLSHDYTRDLGKELFQISRDSFMRTVFIGQNSCETSATTDINARIGALTDNSQDLNSYEAAYARLTAISNKLTPSRMTGTLAKRGDQIARLERIVQDGAGIAESIETYENYLQAQSKDYENLRNEIKEAGSLQTAVTKYQNSLASRDRWRRLKNGADTRLFQCGKAKEAFPGEIPSMDEVEAQISACRSMDLAAERASLSRLSLQEQEEFSRLKKTFARKVPELAEIEKMANDAAQLRELCREYGDLQLSADEMAALKRLEQEFLYDREDISSVTTRWNLRNTKKSALPSNQAALGALKASAASALQKKRGIPALAIVGLIGIIAGIVLFAVSQMVFGAVAVGAGGIFFIAGLLLGRKKSGLPDPALVSQMEVLREAIEDDQAFIERTDEETAKYLGRHGRKFDETAVSSMLHMLMEDSIRYSDLRKRYEAGKNSSLAGQIQKLQIRLRNFLEEYGILSSENRFGDDLYLLKEQASGFRLLERREKDFENAWTNYTAVSTGIRTFLKKYGFSPEENLIGQLNSIRNCLDEYEDSQRLYEEALEELKGFEAEAGQDLLGEISIENHGLEEELPSLEDLNQRILDLTQDMEECRRIIDGYNKTLEGLQEQYDEWNRNREDLQELKELQKTETAKYRYILKAREFLSQARESMTAKYSTPILQSFCRYFEIITARPASHFHMDANTEVTVDELGLQRGVNTLSCGLRDLIGICLRAALVDAMYQEEAPVLIMDDPFINLDDGKLPAARAFLTELSKRYQIIYFTCSGYRSFF